MKINYRYAIIATVIVFGLALASAAGFYFGKTKTAAVGNINETNNAAKVAENESGVAAIDSEIKAASTEESPAAAPTSTLPQNDPAKPAITATTTDEISSENIERFVVAIGANDIDKVAADLLGQGFIGEPESFKKLINPSILAFAPGGYRLSKTMPAAVVAKTLQSKPYMVWIIVPEGLRKEETADLLANDLEWTIDQKEKWIKEDTAADNDYFEGVYFPDTYLIPVNEAPVDVAKRLIAKFNEKFAPYLPEFSRQNIKWTTGLKLASIIQREAVNAADMPLIAGILWNRVEQGMTLDADATLQYARGNTGNGWWAPAAAKDKQIDSPYNTYANKGLPPHPICSPGISAIEATLNPVQTDCLYYLHDSSRATHCAKTYEEHLENIQKYLKNQN
ncbi:MAG: endolytic transglycosylase MltG [Minisyncoccales bacterium]